MKDVVLDACERALESMEDVDCDDAGTNSVAFVGWFWGKWWYVTQCIDYEPNPELSGQYSIRVCNVAVLYRDLNMVFGNCEQQIFLGEKLSSEDLAYQIRERPNLEEARNLMQE